MPADKSLPLVKNADGIWSVTVGPLRSTVYAFWYVLDGSVALDEGNPYIRLRTGGSSVSMVEVLPDSPESIWGVPDVPRGAVEMNWLSPDGQVPKDA